MFGVPPGFHGKPCADFSRFGKIFSKSLKIISEKYFSRHIGATAGRGGRRYWQRCARVSAVGRKNQGGRNGLVAEAHFAEGWLEGDQSFILRTGPGALSSRPGRHTYGQRNFAVLPIVNGKTTIKAGSLPPFSLSVIVPCLLPGRCPVLEEDGGNASTHMGSRPCGAMHLIAVSGFPVLVPTNLHQPFHCLARGNWGKRGAGDVRGSRKTCTVDLSA